jgi:hypothetical protein
VVNADADVVCRRRQAEADNNIAENALRAVSLGRKNFLFFGSDHGAVLCPPERIPSHCHTLRQNGKESSGDGKTGLHPTVL